MWISQDFQCLPPLVPFYVQSGRAPWSRFSPCRQSLLHLGPHDLFHLLLCLRCFNLRTGPGFLSFFRPFFCFPRKARLQFLAVSIWMKILAGDEPSCVARRVSYVHLISFQKKSPDVHCQPNEQQAVTRTLPRKQGSQEHREQR